MNIIDFLKNNKDARKIFGKKELIIIGKQLLGMKLSQSEKNRLSRDIRKKFNFIKEISQYNFDFKLKRGSEIKSLIENIKGYILESEYSKKVEKIYLFGSVTEGTHIFRSDIDIAVEFDKITLKEATKFRIKFNYDRKIDVQVYNILPEKLKKEINKGKIIYERKN